MAKNTQINILRQQIEDMRAKFAALENGTERAKIVSRAKGSKKRAKNGFLAYLASPQRAKDSSKNRAMAAAMRGKDSDGNKVAKASPAQVKAFLATKSAEVRANGTSSRGSWETIARGNGYRL